MMFTELKVILILAAFVGASAGAVWYHHHVYQQGVTVGTNAERAIWQDKEAKRQAAEAVLIATNAETNRLIQKANDAKNLEDGINHEKAIAKVNHQLDILRTAVARNGGLRVAATVCDQPAAGAQAGADSRPADAAAGTIALPDAVTANLLDLAAEADRITEQARALQKRLIEESAGSSP